jgi:hypothetical protein
VGQSRSRATESTRVVAGIRPAHETSTARRGPRDLRAHALAEIGELIESGHFSLPVTKTFPLSPHHKRTRSSGEQRAITVKAAEPDKAAAQPFAQVSALTGPRMPQLPKLRAQMSEPAANFRCPR